MGLAVPHGSSGSCARTTDRSLRVSRALSREAFGSRALEHRVSSTYYDPM